MNIWSLDVGTNKSPLRLIATTLALSVENKSVNCFRGVSITGQSDWSSIPIICALPFKNVSISKAAGASRRKRAASATSCSGLITTSIGR